MGWDWREKWETAAAWCQHRTQARDKGRKIVGRDFRGRTGRGRAKKLRGATALGKGAISLNRTAAVPIDYAIPSTTPR